MPRALADPTHGQRSEAVREQVLGELDFIDALNNGSKPPAEGYATLDREGRIAWHERSWSYRRNRKATRRERRQSQVADYSSLRPATAAEVDEWIDEVKEHLDDEPSAKDLAKAAKRRAKWEALVDAELAAELAARPARKRTPPDAATVLATKAKAADPSEAANSGRALDSSWLEPEIRRKRFIERTTIYYDDDDE